MGQFKPMVKMETTEPSVILKLKKGGHVNFKDGGHAESGHKKMAFGGAAKVAKSIASAAAAPKGALFKPLVKPANTASNSFKKILDNPAFKGRPVVNGSAANPLAKMGTKAAKGVLGKFGKAEGGMADKAQDKAMVQKAMKQHDTQQHADKTKLKLKHGGKMATGGVANSNGGGYKTGGVAMSNAGGYKTGGVAMSNAGGYKDGGMPMTMKEGKKVPAFAADGKGKMAKGGGLYENINAKRERIAKGSGEKMRKVGAAGAPSRKDFIESAKTAKPVKKGYAMGGMVDTGKAEKMPQGMKKPSPPATGQVNFSGAYARGGRAVMAKPMAKTMAKAAAPMATNNSSRALRDDVFKPQAKQMRTRMYKKGGDTGMC
jgi:hypothetical protein